MERLTERNKHGVAVMRLDVPTGMQGGLVATLAAYEDTGLTPEEVVALKVERDAAVEDLEKLMYLESSFDENLACGICMGECKNVGVCRPKWRWPREEDDAL